MILFQDAVLKEWLVREQCYATGEWGGGGSSVKGMACKGAALCWGAGKMMTAFQDGINL